jgi:hemoglobin-like flavoprotein
LLMDAPEIRLTVNEILKVGEFSIVCGGFDGSIHAAIKVLKWIPLENFSKAILSIGNDRKGLSDPSFVRLYNIFQIGPERERRTVLVSEYMRKNSTLLCCELLSADRDKKKPFPVGTAVLLLRRLAQGLSQLHKQSAGKPDWERTLGLLTSDHVYYDQRAERLRVAPIGVSSFLWHILDRETYGEWVDRKSEVYIAPEQWEGSARSLSPKTDQYMLGLLGVELLEGLRFAQILNGKRATEFHNDPEGFIGGTWKSDRKQLWGILKQMLKKEPSERFPDMYDVVQALYALEEEGRVLAKSVYLSPDIQAPGQLVFFEQFYENFFRASPESKKKFRSVDPAEQHQKLMMAMATVRNFRPGNKPTSLDQVLDKHRGKGITRDEFENFHKSFLATMDNFVPDQETREQWNNLFMAVTDYMISECVEPPHQAKTSGAPDRANVYRLPGGKTDVERKTRRKKN